MLMMFKARGAAAAATIWPIIVIAKDGGLTRTATQRIQHPTAKINPERIS